MKNNIYKKNIEGINRCSALADLIYMNAVEKKARGEELFSGEERQIEEYTKIKNRCREAALDNVFAAITAYLNK